MNNLKKLRVKLRTRTAITFFSHCFILTFGFAQIAAAQSIDVGQLPPTVVKLLQAAQLPESALGVVVTPIGKSAGGPILARQIDIALQPASVIKLLTSAVALDILGPQYRGRAELLTNASIKNGVLEGPLVLRGGLGPEMDLRALEDMLKQLQRLGVQQIKGPIIADRSLQNPARPDLGLPPFDESPESQYNFIPDALSLNMNLMPLSISSSADAITINIDKRFNGIQVESRLSLINGLCKDWESQWKVPQSVGNIVVLNGKFPRNCQQDLELNVLDRQVFAATVFKNIWQSLGGQWDGEWIEEASTTGSQITSWQASTPTSSRVLAVHQSRPLSEFVRDINKRSDNPVTRLLYLALGAEKGKSDSLARITTTTTQLSEQVVLQWMRDRQINTDGLVLDNGSGLSRTEKISPRQLALTLQAAYASPWQPEFLASMPIVGLDGSMRNRLKQMPVTQRGRFKTGGLRNVTSVAGFINDSQGNVYVVVAMLNDDKASGAASRKVLDAILEWVAAYSPEP